MVNGETDAQIAISVMAFQSYAHNVRLERLLSNAFIAANSIPQASLSVLYHSTSFNEWLYFISLCFD